MIEPIMYFGIGFLFAAISVLVVVPLVHGRAVRHTVRRLQRATPSALENQAKKDLLRTEFARSTRALEIKVEELQARNVSQLAELGQRRDAINRLQIELGALRQQLCTIKEEFALKTTAMEEAERALSEKESKLAKLMTELEERSGLVDAQQIEIVALKTEVGAKATAVKEIERTSSEKESKLAKLMTELDERCALVDVQKIEIIALKTKVEANATAMQEGARTLSEQESKLAKLVAELDERSALDFAQEITIIALKSQVTAKAAAKQEAENALSETESRLAKLKTELDERSAVADTQQVEIAVLKNQVEVLKEHLDRVSNELKAVEELRDAEHIEFKTLTQELMEERSNFYNFHCRVAGLVQQVVLQTTEDRRAQEELENRLADQSRHFNEREFEIEQLRSEIEMAHKFEADLRVAIDEIDARDKTAIQSLEAETEKLRAALDRANGERMRLTYELANIKRQVNCAA